MPVPSSGRERRGANTLAHHLFTARSGPANQTILLPRGCEEDSFFTAADREGFDTSAEDIMHAKNFREKDIIFVDRRCILDDEM
jgi:hypothetical protein